MTYWSHSANELGEWQTQRDHLLGVTERLIEFAGPLGIGDEARITGLLHDAGKYSDVFQRVLEGKAAKIDHWSPGAWLALFNFQSIAAALAIQGHHIGLQCGLPDSLRELCPRTLASAHPLNLTLSGLYPFVRTLC